MSLLSDCASLHLENLSERLDLSFLDEIQLAELTEVLSLSDFVADSLMKQPELLAELFNSGLFESAQRTVLLKR